MKALFYKDSILLNLSPIIWLVISLFIIVPVFIQPIATSFLLCGLITMRCLQTLSTDANDHFAITLHSLPITRSSYFYQKYLLVLGGFGSSLLISATFGLGYAWLGLPSLTSALLDDFTATHFLQLYAFNLLVTASAMLPAISLALYSYFTFTFKYVTSLFISSSILLFYAIFAPLVMKYSELTTSELLPVALPYLWQVFMASCIFTLLSLLCARFYFFKKLL